MLTEVIRGVCEEPFLQELCDPRGSRLGQFARGQHSPPCRAALTCMGTISLTWVGMFSSSQEEKKTFNLKTKPPKYLLFHIPTDFHANQSLCPGVLLSSAMG